jgi:hypothetical protein
VENFSCHGLGATGGDARHGFGAWRPFSRSRLTRGAGPWGRGAVELWPRSLTRLACVISIWQFMVRSFTGLSNRAGLLDSVRAYAEPRPIGSFFGYGHRVAQGLGFLDESDVAVVGEGPAERRPFRCQRGDQCRVRAEEEIADCRAPAVSDPALRQMVRPVVQHVAALTERAQIL